MCGRGGNSIQNKHVSVLAMDFCSMQMPGYGSLRTTSVPHLSGSQLQRKAAANANAKAKRIKYPNTLPLCVCVCISVGGWLNTAGADCSTLKWSRSVFCGRAMRASMDPLARRFNSELTWPKVSNTSGHHMSIEPLPVPVCVCVCS